MHRRLPALAFAAALLCAAAGVAQAQPAQGARPAARGGAPAPAQPDYAGPSQPARMDAETLEFSLERATRPTILATVLTANLEPAPLPLRQQERITTRPDRPEWVDESQDLTRARIARIVPGVADVVVLDRGLYQGLRVGTPCLVIQDGIPVGGLIIVASTPERAAALISSQATGAKLRVGDAVRLQVFTPAPTTRGNNRS